MYDVFRDSAVGQCCRFLTNNRVARYSDELPGFKLPRCRGSDGSGPGVFDRVIKESPLNLSVQNEASDNCSGRHRLNEYSDGMVVVTWWSDDDVDNPHNWGKAKKSWTSFVILLYTFGIYLGASIYTASSADISRIFHISPIAASVGLSVYIIGYGLGPLLWSPLSEIPAVGRNLPYVTTFFVFIILCVPTALVDNFAGLLVLRALLGFFGSPALATGGASYGDFYGAAQMPCVLAFWGGGATLGPVRVFFPCNVVNSMIDRPQSLGPVVAGFAVHSETWRWSAWELLWLCGPIWVLMFLSLPETSADLILLQRARRLRKLTGRTEIKAECEVRQSRSERPERVVFNALIKPWEINIRDPAMLFTTIYTALIYGIYYSFFESFPIVYGEMYGWTLGQTGLAFLAVLVGLLVAVLVYCAYFYFVAGPQIARMEAQKSGTVPPEARLKPGLVATFLIPIGLYVFGEFHFSLRPVREVRLTGSSPISLDSQTIDLLVGFPPRCRNKHARRLHYHAMHIHLPALYLPQLRRLALRCQWVRESSLCRGCGLVLEADV